jgi:dTDP-4-amino-4,6-dideoxygalactose transaminase
MRIGRQTVSLPLSPALTDADVADVIAAVRLGILA